MEPEIPYKSRLDDVLSDRVFKRKLVLWHYYVKNLTQKEISEQTNISTSTISDIIRKWREQGIVEDLVRSGRERGTSEEQEEMIVELQKENRHKTGTTIHREILDMGHDLSYKQTLKVINENFISVYAPYMIHLSEKNMEKRVAFCEKLLKWRDSHWNEVIWTDEKIFKTNPQNHKIVVKILFDENLEDFSIPRKQQGGKSLMVWGAISQRGKLHLQILKGKIDSLVFSKFLEEDGLPMIRQNHGRTFCLQLDNAPAHKKHTTSLLENKKIRTLDWPPQSPDLNPIEQVWLWMATKLKGKTFNNLQELEEDVFALWEEIPQETIFSYIRKVKDKVLWVRDAGGALYPDHA